MHRISLAVLCFSLSAQPRAGRRVTVDATVVSRGPLASGRVCHPSHWECRDSERGLGVMDSPSGKLHHPAVAWRHEEIPAFLAEAWEKTAANQSRFLSTYEWV